MPELRGGSLRARLNRFFTVCAVLLAVYVALVVILGLRVRDAEEELTVRLFDAVRHAETSRAAVLDQDSDLRGYLVTGQPSFLDAYTSAVAEEATANNQVRPSLQGEVELAGLYQVAVDAALEWREEYAELAQQLLAPDVVGTLPEELTATGTRLLDDYRTAYTAYATAALESRQQAKDRLDQASIALAVTLTLGVLGLCVVGVALSLALRRWVTEPVEDLAAQTRLVAEGRYDHRVTSSGPGEIGRLAGDVEAMRSRIVQDLEVVAKAHRDLEAANSLLESQAHELQRSNAELEQFAYVASHDLQEPLRKISSFTQLLQKRYGGQLDVRADQYIAFAVDGAKRMQVLISDLLGFSRVGRVGTDLRKVSLDECLDEGLRSLGTALEESGARVERVPLPHVRGDRTLLTQVFQNLVGNSVKFRGEAAPVVRITSSHDQPTDAGEPARWVICVRDNGIGVDPQFADKVFVIFQRLHGREEYEGTGIGLALCRKIVEFHGGRLWLQPPSDDGPGATFCFTLPVLETVEPTVVPDPSTGSPASPGGSA